VIFGESYSLLVTELRVGGQCPHASLDIAKRTRAKIPHAGDKLKTIVGHLLFLIKERDRVPIQHPVTQTRRQGAERRIASHHHQPATDFHTFPACAGAMLPAFALLGDGRGVISRRPSEQTLAAVNPDRARRRIATRRLRRCQDVAGL
jgi:hypothetical protein